MAPVSSDDRAVPRTPTVPGPPTSPVDADERPSGPTSPAVDERERRRGPSPRVLQAVLTALLVTPLVVALVALHRPRWFPILDLSMTELRVRDVGSVHTPLIGLPGRIGVFGGERGSHPGPLSFWMLAPTYRLLGSTAWAMEVGTVVLHGTAMSLTLWLGRRRAGVALMAGLAAVLALLTSSYGADVLTQPWNPYMPLLWWVLLMVSTWAVLCRDVVALPIAVFAASFCAQTHVPYLALTGALGAVALLGAAGAYRKADDAAERRRVLRWVGGSTLLGVVLWAPVLLDQATVDPGNISLLIDHFASPPEEPVGLGRAVEMVLLHLDPWRLLTGQGTDTGSLAGASSAPSGSYLPGLTVLLAWVASVVVAWRLRLRDLLRLHLVVGVSLVVGTYAISRIFGLLWYYLMIWAWGITGLLLLAVGWTATSLLSARASSRPGRGAGPGGDPRWARRGVGALLAVTLVSTVAFSARAADVEQPAEALSAEMAVLTPEIVAALSDDSRPHGGQDQRYLATWTDSINIGAQGISLVNELERNGFDVGVIEPWSVHVSRHRARDLNEATAAVHLASGDGPVAAWRARPDAEEIASVDRRTPAERAEFDRVHQRVVDQLEAEGLDDVAALVDENLFLAAIDERLTPEVHADIDRMLELGQSTAAFLGPPSMLQ